MNMHRSKNTPLLVESIGFLLLGFAMIVYSLVNHTLAKVEWKQSPYLFPLLVAIFIIPLALSLLRTALKGPGPKLATEGSLLGTLLVGLATITYVVLIPIITFVPASILFLAGVIRYLGEKRIWLIALLSILFPLTMYLLFGVVLHVMLP